MATSLQSAIFIAGAFAAEISARAAYPRLCFRISGYVSLSDPSGAERVIACAPKGRKTGMPVGGRAGSKLINPFGRLLLPELHQN